MSDTWTFERSLLARLTKAGYPPDSPEILAARQRMNELLVIDQVAKIINAAAPLTDKQVQRITALLVAP